MTLVRRLKRAGLALLPSPARRRVRRLHYARLVRRYPLADLPDLAQARTFVAPGDWVVDVGASVGVYARHFSEWVGANGRVVAFEPVPDTFDLLEHTVRKLGLDNVHTSPLAVSDHEGQASMRVPPGPDGLDDMYRAHVVDAEAGGETDAVPVGATTLDGALADRPRPLALVKCDVEGHELAVLRGAQGILQRDRAVWLLEVNDDPDVAEGNAASVFDWMRRFGYQPYVREGYRLAPRAPGRRTVNYFFLPPHRRPNP